MSQAVIGRDRRTSSADRYFECTSTEMKESTRNTGSLIKAAVALKRIRNAPRLVNTVEDYPSMTLNEGIVAAVRTLILCYEL